MYGFYKKRTQVMGLAFALFVMKTNGSSNIIKGVLYFVAMEILQVVQYNFIATDVDPAKPTLAQIEASPVCQSSANRFLTVIGLLHIAFQPFYSAHLSCAFVRSEVNVAQFNLVKKFQLLGAGLIMMRFFLTYVPASTYEAMGFNPANAFDKNAWTTSIEWLDGPALCTYAGVKHLAWSVPLAPVSYYVPSMALHSFLMFAPFFVMDHGGFLVNIPNYIAGALLFATGPVVGDWLTPNKHESASIWCFFSIMQVVVLVLMIVIQRHLKGKWFTWGVEPTPSNKGKKA